jgi:hypothetical protein
LENLILVAPHNFYFIHSQNKPFKVPQCPFFIQHFCMLHKLQSSFKSSTFTWNLFRYEYLKKYNGTQYLSSYSMCLVQLSLQWICIGCVCVYIYKEHTKKTFCTPLHSYLCLGTYFMPDVFNSYTYSILNGN